VIRGYLPKSRSLRTTMHHYEWTLFARL
jgi:hypothetical protein